MPSLTSFPLQSSIALRGRAKGIKSSSLLTEYIGVGQTGINISSSWRLAYSRVYFNDATTKVDTFNIPIVFNNVILPYGIRLPVTGFAVPITFNNVNSYRAIVDTITTMNIPITFNDVNSIANRLTSVSPFTVPITFNDVNSYKGYKVTVATEAIPIIFNDVASVYIPSVGDYTGFIVPYTIEQINFPSDLDNYTFDFWPPHENVIPDEHLVGILTDNTPINIENVNFTGSYDKNSIYERWYDQIHINPQEINLGLILSNKYYTAELWNAYLSTKTLLTISGVNTLGIELTAPETLPIAFRGLASKIFNITVTPIGPATVDGTFTFNFNVGGTSLYLHGIRVTLWPYIPKAEFSEYREFSTQVLSAKNAEDRISFRPIPRTILSYSYLFNSQKEFAEAKALARFANSFGLSTPYWIDYSIVTNVISGQNTIYLNTANKEIKVGDVAVLYTNSSTYEIINIAEVYSDRVITQLTIENNYSKVYFIPIKTCLTPNGIDFSREVGGKVTANIEYITTDSYYNPFWFDDKLFLTLPVWPYKIVMKSAISEKILQDSRTFDSGSGVLTVHEDILYSRQQSTITLIARNLADRYKYMRALEYLAGKYKPFWVPTQNVDIIPISTASLNIGTNSLTIKSLNWAIYGFKNIQIIGATNTVEVEIISVTAGSNNTETLIFGSPLAIATGTILYVYELLKVRSSTDKFEISTERTIYKTDKTVITTFTLPIIEVP